MAEGKNVWVEAVKRFNHHNPGDVFEADPDDAKYWKSEKLVKMAKAPEEKAEGGPPADKAVKGAEVKK